MCYSPSRRSGRDYRSADASGADEVGFDSLAFYLSTERGNMSYYETNPYYSPANVGAEMVAILDVSPPDWSFDMVILLRKVSDGTLWVAHDSGCSCPTPFENHTFTDSFVPVRSVADAEEFVRPFGGVSMDDAQDFYNSVREALR